jgi:hypothetical protein
MPFTPRRFPPPWSVEELDAAFVVKDSSGQKLTYIYYEEEPGRRSAAKLLSRDEAWRIAACGSIIYFPHCRTILSPVAIKHGFLFNGKNPEEEHINERIHWGMIAKRGAMTTPAYEPPNLPGQIAEERIAAIAGERT